MPYRGPAYQDVADGLIQVGFPTVLSALPCLQNGRLRALAVTTPKRMAVLPDFPAFAEAGVKVVVVTNWYGIIAPGRTPKPVVERVAKEIATAMRSPEIVKLLTADSSEPVGSSPSEFAASIRAQHEQWSRVNKQARTCTHARNISVSWHTTREHCNCRRKRNACSS